MPTTSFLSFFIGGELVTMVERTGLVARLVLLILLGFSVLSWGIMLAKWQLFKRAGHQSARFRKAFRKAQRLQDMAVVVEQFKPSPLVAVFEHAFEEVRRQSGQPRNMVAVQRSIQIGASEELTRLERRLPWLAITAATTPFIGLFGTVWGIIDSFQGLGDAGAATLRAVAPGMSEALITTAAGLFAAIPAVIAYNLLSHKVREFGSRMDDFGLEFLNAVERSAPARQPDTAEVVR
jgi:biopolymer transport protein TolQ